MALKTSKASLTKNSQDFTKRLRDESIKRVSARRHFLPFLKYIAPWFRVSWHHELIADKLEKFQKGEIKRLMFLLPPRHSKSEMASVAFPAWAMGINKDDSVIEASYSSDLAVEFGRQTRNIVDSQEYQRLFDTRLAEDSSAKSTWSTNGRGKYNAVGVGGSVTGKGAKYLIIDDPIKNRKDADSWLVRENVYNWYRSTARTRLSPDGGVCIVLTRWHDNDLAGRLLEEDPDQWDVVCLPAIAVDDEENRKKGDALWPDQYPINNLLQIKKDIGSYEWSSLYQQNPINNETQEFKKNMFQYVSMDELRHKRTIGFVTIDPSTGKEQEGRKKDKTDFTGITFNRVDSKGTWYFRTKKVKVDSADLVNLIFDIWRDEKPEMIGIESTTYTDAVEPFMRLAMQQKQVFPVIVPLKHNQTNKNLRIRGLLPRYEAKMIFHVEGECDDLEEEALRFPKGAHDDVLDSAQYQGQIAYAPAPVPDIIDEMRDVRGVDDRTGYLK